MNQPSMAQYRTYNPAQGRPQPPAPIRRAQMPPNQAQVHPGTVMRQQPPNAVAQEQQKADTRARKPTDRNIPEGVEDIAIGDGVGEYKKMREVEKRLDAIMMRKVMEISDKKHTATDRRRKLRIWITNTVENQPWQNTDFDDNNNFDFSSSSNNSRIKFKIVGKLLDDEGNLFESERKDTDAMDTDGDDGKEKSDDFVSPVPKMSTFFKSIKMEIDRSRTLQADEANLVEWQKEPSNPNLPSAVQNKNAFDTLAFSRKGDENLQCTFKLYRDEYPERYSVNEHLAKVIDREEASREEVITAIWEYTKVNELQQDEDKRMIQCDQALRTVFGKDTFRFPELGVIIMPHLTPLPPIKLAYTARVDEEFHKNPVPTVYDVLVSSTDHLHNMRQALLNNPKNAIIWKELAGLDEQLAAIVQAITDSKSRHAFFSEMSKDPATFIRKWLSSQKRDLEVILADSRYGSGVEFPAPEFRRGGENGVWGSQSVKESVGLMVASRK